MSATLSSTLLLPTHATASAFTADGKHLAVGSDDGSVRLYAPPESKVQKAIRGLGATVSSVLFHSLDVEDLWVAAGKSVYRFDLSASKMIFTPTDAKLSKDIGEDDEDVVNQLALNTNRTYLAATTDGGSVSVLDLSVPPDSDGVLSKMKTAHASIAWAAAFVPDRPSELLTGGYDCALLLHDFKLRTLLARLDITPAPPLAPGISSLPPFITALALSPHAAIAAGTADGRIWLGLGGAKGLASTKAKTKRSRKWGGLAEADGFFTKVGENLIAGLQFTAPDMLLSCTVHGKLAAHQLTSNLHLRQSQNDVPAGGLRTLWTAQSACTKVDIVAFPAGTPAEYFAVAGLHADKKRGAVELWNVQTQTPGGAQEQIVEETSEKAEGIE